MTEQFSIDLSSDRFKLDLFTDYWNCSYFSPQEITEDIYSVENLVLGLAFEGYSNKRKQQAIAE